jgi:GT2 family glycosyltransferase
MKPKVVVIIVIWNGVNDTIECLRSLLQDGYPNLDIVVVDNGSSDGSVALLREMQFPVRIIEAGSNLGFTGGNNLGMAEAKRLQARYVFLLNNDTTLERGVIKALVDAAEANPAAAIVAPVMHYYDNPSDVWFAGATVNLATAEATHDASARPSRWEPPYATSWVSGCGMLVKMVAIEQVGGFDDRFYLTWEDVDWCLRMRRVGWNVVVAPKARIFHKGGRSGAKLSGVRSYYAVRNSLLLASKHSGWRYCNAFIYVIGRHIRAGLRSSSPDRREILSTTFEGLRDHMLGNYGCRGKVKGTTQREIVKTGATQMENEGRGIQDAVGANKQ